MTSNAARIREINDSIRYTMWSVFRLRRRCSATPTAPPRAAEVEKLFAELAEDDVVVRGVYDVSGLRADADVMVWWHADDVRGAAGGVPPVPPHRVRPPARAGLVADGAAPPGRVQQEPHAGVPRRRGAARRHVCVYPFVRSYEWYLLEDAERRRLLAEHGKMARDYPDVRANTVAQLRARRLRVDPGVRGRRAAPHRRPDAAPARLRARRHVREEVPFYTGARVAGRRPGRPAALTPSRRVRAGPAVGVS